MGIDIYLKWAGMEEEEKSQQHTGFSTVHGHVGYLREAYHGGPYATQILVREAFDADNCEAEIPAATMRERLTRVTEPARGCNGGHDMAQMISMLMRAATQHETDTHVTDVVSGDTQPMSVEEAVRERYATIYPDAGAEEIAAVVQSYRNFVALAERKEAETGKPCRVYASY